MRILAAAVALCAAVLAAAESELIDSTTVYIQPLTSSSSPLPLAEIKFNPSTLSAEITSYESPDLPENSKLLRVGIYDPSSAMWKSSTSITSPENFAKGYSPTIVLNLDTQGAVIGVSCKSSLIDAGQTRDFGPRVKVVGMREGKKPELNRPVVLSPEGKLAEPEVEKTLFQRFWWVGLAGLMLLMTAGGGGE
ncbi:hypothetical protein QTJ16_006277 [Diplocarpon rosae]|uniref:Cyclin-dependent protein kinase regulator pho80 n=1 Tax=Diplocarpon rosae TaxID=946125 RepID=A0AAD9SVN7_9HELO|nr:hypothetical protein QTJ16_006277 [Diplocarpon rosae]PBP28164.1 cyclin-dependent protein kinase regulator pho80 [Diplocarpon rosae]